MTGHRSRNPLRSLAATALLFVGCGSDNPTPQTTPIDAATAPIQADAAPIDQAIAAPKTCQSPGMICGTVTLPPNVTAKAKSIALALYKVLPTTPRQPDVVLATQLAPTLPYPIKVDFATVPGSANGSYFVYAAVVVGGTPPFPSFGLDYVGFYMTGNLPAKVNFDTSAPVDLATIQTTLFVDPTPKDGGAGDGGVKDGGSDASPSTPDASGLASDTASPDVGQAD